MSNARIFTKALSLIQSADVRRWADLNRGVFLAKVVPYMRDPLKLSAYITCLWLDGPR